jgi:putative flippase GtrA
MSPTPQPDSAKKARTTSALARARDFVVHNFPPGQFARYLTVGLVNTIFGYCSFAVLNKLLTPHMPYAYILVGPIANVINITFSLLNYKWVIFKTNGNYVREWLRCAAVSSGGVILGTLSLPTLVILIRYLTPFKASAPYIGWAILLGASVLMSFIGHRRFTFAQAAPVPSANFDDENLDQSI